MTDPVHNIIKKTMKKKRCLEKEEKNQNSLSKLYDKIRGKKPIRLKPKY